MNLPLKGERVIITELQKDQLPVALAIINSNPQLNKLRHGVAEYSLADWERVQKQDRAIKEVTGDATTWFARA